MRTQINRILKKILVRLTSPEEKNIKDTTLKNVFNTSYKKTALLSYIKKVFTDTDLKNDLSHTNRFTTYVIAEVLRDIGYNVDVIDWNEDLEDDFNKYDLVTGLGKSLDQVIQQRDSKSKTKVIWFGTGCNPLFSNVVTLNRIADFYNRTRHLLLDSSRYIKEDWPLQHEFCDWMILHGSTFAKSTYSTKKISCINAPVFIYHSIERTEKEWQTAKNNYLWFGTGGLIHKGLDLTIEAFKSSTNLNLHICGDMTREPAFYNHYKNIIETKVNITYHGFVDVDSDSFAKILQTCAFIVFPSASEGNCASVITCMANGGLIPIVTKNADIDTADYGIIIEDLTAEAVQKSLTQSQNLTIEELKLQSTTITQQTRNLNSFEYFRADFTSKLQNALKTLESNDEL